MDLPAPLGPSTAQRSDSSTFQVTWSRIGRPLRTTVASLNSRTVAICLSLNAAHVQASAAHRVSQRAGRRSRWSRR
ncbi:hypothetical protein ACFPRL_02135 [Pseudoclavibacter helvolus]